MKSALVLAVLLLLAPAAVAGEVSVLDDFESPASAQHWDGPIALSRQQSSHGAQSAHLRLERGRAQASLSPSIRDWRSFDRLAFDVYGDREIPQTLSLRICEDASGADPDRCFEASRKVVVLKGWNHIEVKFPLRSASFQRNLSLGHLRRISLYAERVRLPWAIYLDNIRLVRGQEGPETASRTEPNDGVCLIDNRWFTSRQVARPEDVPESRQVKELRGEAGQELERLRETIRTAQLQGIDTIYAERFLVTADLGLHVRPRLPWFNTDAKKTGLFRYVIESCRLARRELEDLLDGAFRLPHTDDTQVGESLVPAYPPTLRGSPRKGWFFLDRHGNPMTVISLHSPSQLLQRFFATPRQHIESYSVGGGSRWTIDESPVYEAFHKYPGTHRVGWDGWCGHLVRDLDSMGGTKKENVVICLESPHIREAVDEYIRINIPKFHSNPQLLYNIMAYELMYICYCDRSQQMFREWLKGKHETIERVNEIYGSAYKDFSDIVAPPVKHSRPLPGTNRALWYDWARFNMDRFTGYLLWVKSRIRKLDPNMPLAAGGSSSMLAGRTGTTGIDEERIVNEVDDVIIHEGGGSTLGVDLQMALAETKKPLADPEMALRSVYNLLPHALHGKTVMQFFHWPAQPQNEYFSMNGSSLAHSWSFSLADISELIRATLDARRLSKEIGAFIDSPAEVALLYSQTATLQLPPEMLTWSTTPYLAELEKSYEASRYLDAKTTFITERQIEEGWLARYTLLIVPAVRNVPAGVVEKIWDYASAGGRVLIVPESFLGDEYNHPKNFIERLGITIERTERPKPGGVGAMAQGYDQSFSQEVSFTGDALRKLKPAAGGSWNGIAGLTALGVRQIIRTATPAQPLFLYPDGTPAIARVPLGRGLVYYSSASLDERDYARLLDVLYDDAGVSRPLRVRSLGGGDTWKVEARLAQSGHRNLLYIVNFHDRPIRLRLDSPAGFFESLYDLRRRTEAPAGEVALEPRQTAIFELR